MSDASLIGQIVGGRYRLGPVIGSGGMGVVHHAEHVLLGAPMAVKLLRTERVPVDRAMERRFEREARVAAAFKHPNVVAMIDYGRDEALGAYVVMERLEGESLAERLDARKRLTVRETIAIVRQVLAGLGAGHAQSLVHRDVKPSNVFLARHPDGGEIVKLLDFGASKSFVDPRHEITSAGVILGTPPYMAPEVLIEGAGASASADLYAVGVLMYRMLTGRLPYTVRDPADLLQRILSGGPELPRTLAPEIPPALEALIMRTLAPDPAQRPRSARELRDALETILGEVGDAGLEPSERPARSRGQLTTTELDVQGTELDVDAAPPPRREATLALADAPTLVDPDAQPHETPESRTGARTRSLRPAALASTQSASPPPVRDVKRPRTSWMNAETVRPAARPRVREADITTERVRHEVRRAGQVVLGLALIALFAILCSLLWRAYARPASSSEVASSSDAAPEAGSPEIAGSSEAPTGTTRGPEVADAPPAPPVALDLPPPDEAAEAQVAPRGDETSIEVADEGSDAVRARRGYLSLVTSPWSHVEENGRSLGDTPLVRIPLAPGRHTLRLRNPEADVDVTYVVEIEPGRITSRRLGLR